MQRIALDLPVEILLLAASDANKEHEDELSLMRRSRNVISTNFNLNIFKGITLDSRNILLFISAISLILKAKQSEQGMFAIH